MLDAIRVDEARKAVVVLYRTLEALARAALVAAIVQLSKSPFRRQQIGSSSSAEYPATVGASRYRNDRHYLSVYQQILHHGNTFTSVDSPAPYMVE